jgi:succinoglycan biosynthesis protein ExoA
MRNQTYMPSRLHNANRAPVENITSGCAASLKSVESVSVVIPCYNEVRFIGKVLENLADQYELQHYEIIIVDGMSEDGTRDLIETFKLSHPELSITLLDNPARKIPVALNTGIAAARGNIIARMDAHAFPSNGYIRRCVEVLRQERAGVVGMPCHVRPGADTLMARAIASAVSHPFGIGDAKYRLQEGASAQEPVDTVAFACFRKSLWAELGGFNEILVTNEDYDFNYRVRLSGQQVLLDRSGHCDYFARTTLSKLASQYFRYGGWKARMVKMHPRSIKLRHTVAPLFVASMILLAVMGLWWSIAWWLLALELVIYLLAAISFGAGAARRFRGGLLMMLVMPIVFFTIHSVWGSSFLLQLPQPRRYQV